MSTFRPKRGLVYEPSAQPGENYPDTLENFLRPRLDKVHSKVVVLDSSGGPPAPHKRGTHEETQAHRQSTQ